MAFVMADLTVLASTTAGTVWLYASNDTIDVIAASGYFSSASNKLAVRDRILVSADLDGTPSNHILSVTAIGTVTTAGWGAAAAQAAAPAGGTGAAAGGYDTASNRDAMIATVNAMRTALINAGIMKGAA